MITINSIIRDIDAQLTELETEQVECNWRIMSARERHARAARVNALQEALIIAHVSKLDPDYLSPSGKPGVL